MVDNNKKGQRCRITQPDDKTILNPLPLQSPNITGETGSRNASLQPRHQRTRRSTSVLQRKLYSSFLSLPIRSSLSLMETMPLFLLLLLLLPLSNSLVSSDPQPRPQPIMTFPSENLRREQGGTTGTTYSLFPDEDLRTGKKIRFDDEQLNRGRPVSPHSHHSGDRDYIGYRYPIMFEDRFHRPGDYHGLSGSGGGGSGSASRFDRDRSDPFRTRGSRLYFDDEIGRDRDRDRDRGRDRDRDRYYPMDDRFPAPSRNYYGHDRFSTHYDRREQQRPLTPSLLDRPLSPVRPYHYSDTPVPGPSHSKLPVGASLSGFRGGGGGGGSDVRIHVFDPESNSFGNPRNSGRNSNSNSNSFVPSPDPELFLNHDQYLEYHRKIAAVREQEFKRLQALGLSTPANQKDSTESPDPKRVLFTAQQPFEISRLSPPAPEATTPNPGQTMTQGQSPSGTGERRNNENTRHYQDNEGQVPIAIYTGSSGSGAGTVAEGNNNPHPPSSALTHNNHHIGSVGEQNNEAIHNNDPASTSTTKNDAYRGGSESESEKEAEIESENSKTTQVIQLSPEKSRSRPNFISKSGRRLAYEQIQRQIQSQSINTQRNLTTDEEHVGYLPSVTQFGVRQPLTSFSSFDEVSPVAPVNQNQIQVNNDGKGDGDIRNLNKVTTTTTTTSTAKSTSVSAATLKRIVEQNQDVTTATATALSLIEIPNEADGFVQVAQFNPASDTKTFKSNPHKHQRPHIFQRNHLLKSSSYMGKKSELGTQVSKSRSRIKSQSGDKIAIIKQQELKQKRKKESNRDQTYYHNQNPHPHKSDLSSVNFFENSATTTTTNFQIPILPLKTGGVRIREMKLQDLILKNNYDIGHRTDDADAAFKSKSKFNTRHPFLDNNDLVDPATAAPVVKFQKSESAKNNGNLNGNRDKNQEKGYFTLINQNNDEVDILEENENENEVTTPSLLFVSSKKNEKASPPSPSTSTSKKHEHRQVDIDLFHNPNNSEGIVDNNDDMWSRNEDKYQNQYPRNGPFPSASNFIKVIRLRDPNKAFTTVSASTNNLDLSKSTASKTRSMFMVQKEDYFSEKKDNAAFASHRPRVVLSSSINSTTLSLLKSGNYKNMLNGKKRDPITESESTKSSPVVVGNINTDARKNVTQSTGQKEDLDSKIVSAHRNEHQETEGGQKMKMSMTSSTSHGVIKKVHAHVSHCPKLHSPAEIICDIHIRESHGHPNPQFTVGWRRKFYNSTQPDILLVSNMTKVYEEIMMEPQSSPQFNNNRHGSGNNGSSVTPTTTTTPIRDGNGEDFHDKFNVTLAPGISPMLRSVLLIRSVTGPDCGNYQCQVTDGVYTLSSETLLFLCH